MDRVSGIQFIGSKSPAKDIGLNCNVSIKFDDFHEGLLKISKQSFHRGRGLRIAFMPQFVNLGESIGRCIELEFPPFRSFPNGLKDGKTIYTVSFFLIFPT
jgi:hypothetical protein